MLCQVVRTMPFGLLLLLMGASWHASAQIFSNQVANPMSSEAKIISDSTGKKKALDDGIVIFTYTDHPIEKTALDTSIFYLHRNPLLADWVQDIGNIGLPAQQRFFTPRTDPAVFDGLYSAHLYHFSAATNPFYNTTRPYTSLYYRLGSQQEQMLELFHTQNIHERWNVAIRYAKVGSPGFYKLQKSNNDHLAITSHYRSANGRYSMKTSLFYNKLQQDENGGIIDEADLLKPAYSNKRLMPVHAVNVGGRQNNSSIKNYTRQLELRLLQSYSLTKPVAGADTMPQTGLCLNNTVYTLQGFHWFRDYSPDSAFYAPLGVGSFALGDSLYSEYLFRRTGTFFSLQGAWNMLGQTWQTEGGWGVERETPENTGYSPSFINTYLQAQLRNINLMPNAWRWQAQFKQYLSGNALGNLALDVRITKGWEQQTIAVFAKQSVQTAPYTYTHFASNYAVWEADLKKQLFTQMGLHYTHAGLRTQATVQYHLIGNYTYRDSLWQVQQSPTAIGLWQAKLSQTLRLKSLYWENEAVLQWVNSEAPLKLPRAMLRSNLSYRNRLFKNKLEVATGVEALWHSAYYANRYVPYVNDFVLQQQAMVSNYPRVTAYVQLKVKRFRGSVSVSDLQQLVVPNAILYPNYAAPNRALHVAFYWAFVN